MRRLLLGMTVGLGLLAGCAPRATRPTPPPKDEREVVDVFGQRAAIVRPA